MSEAIRKFRGKYAFLSNFHPSTVEYEGIVYPTSEAVFQAAKTFDVETRKEIAALKTPMEAKNFGRSIPIRSDWESIKVSIMEEVCLLKFTQHPELREKLLATGDVYLEEGNTHGDTTWGTVNGKGTNFLGFVLMRIRDKLRGTIEDTSGFQVKRKNKKAGA